MAGEHTYKQCSDLVALFTWCLRKRVTAEQQQPGYVDIKKKDA